MRVLAVERCQLGGDALTLGLACDARNGDMGDSRAWLDTNLLWCQPQLNGQCFPVGLGLVDVPNLYGAHAGADATH